MIPVCRDGEAALNAWLEDNAWVCSFPCDQPWLAEAARSAVRTCRSLTRTVLTRSMPARPKFVLERAAERVSCPLSPDQP
jgi:hypothetical protein